MCLGMTEVHLTVGGAWTWGGATHKQMGEKWIPDPPPRSLRADRDRDGLTDRPSNTIQYRRVTTGVVAVLGHLYILSLFSCCRVTPHIR